MKKLLLLSLFVAPIFVRADLPVQNGEVFDNLGLQQSDVVLAENGCTPVYDENGTIVSEECGKDQRADPGDREPAAAMDLDQIPADDGYAQSIDQ